MAVAADEGAKLFERSEFLAPLLQWSHIPVAEGPVERVPFLLLTFLWARKEK